MPRKRRRVWAGFTVFAVLFACGIFVLHDVASGAVLFVAVLVLIWTGMYALRDEDRDSVRDNERRGLGWIWF